MMVESVANIGSKQTTGMSRTDAKANTILSPSIEPSSDTLHHNSRFDGEHKHLNISPFSTATLDFDDLRINDDVVSCAHKDDDHFASSFQSNFKRQNVPTPAFGHPVQQYRRYNCHYGPGNGSPRGGNARNARTWVSEEVRAAQEFLVVRNSMKRLFKNADIAKWKVADYIAHREAMTASAAKKLAQQAQDREHEISLRVPPISPQQQETMRHCGLSGNFDQVSNYSRALGEKTIWCEDWQNGKDEIAPWPCLAEMKWEGDDRAKTGVGRFPPLPREQGPVGLPWNQLQAVEQYPIDQIARIPTMEDVYLPVDEIDDEVKYDLLSEDLEDAMDAYLQS